MRILVVSERYWPDGSGGELATHLILKLLGKESFNVKVITGTKGAETTKGVEYIFEPLLTKSEKAFLWPNVVRLTRRQYFRKLAEWADIIYIPRFSYPVIPFAKRLGKKVVVHLHGYIPISYTATVLAPFEKHRNKIVLDDISMECSKGVKNCIGVLALWWLPRLAREWIVKADTVICVSKRQAQIVSELIPKLKDKTKVVYNPLREIPKAEKNLSEKPTFLYVGGGSYVKGFHILIKALEAMTKNFKLRAKFIFTNKYIPKQMRMLEKLKEKYDLDIEVVGRISDSELLNLHSKAWALLFPSIWEEPLPYAVLEAMALGTIPIASKVGGVPEIVEGTYAENMTFEPEDLYNFIEKIEEILSLSKEQIIETSITLRENISNKFDLLKIKSQLLSIFQLENI